MNKKDLKFNEKSQNKKSTKACPNLISNLQPLNSKFSNLTSHISSLTSNSRGITLIALVITIIVMLILVGVTVSVAINGGLFSTAKRAVSKTEKAKDSELRLIAMANAATHDKLWEYTSQDNKKIPIPAGFAPTKIEGEDKVEEGLVIIDAEGNEFVWIPCTSSAYKGAIFQDGWHQYRYTNYEWTDDQTAIGEKSLKKLEYNKEELGLSEECDVGFYVGRYEAGIPENAPFYASEDGDPYKIYKEEEGTDAETKQYIRNTTEYKPVSKKGMPAWNFINQTNAKTVSKNMYNNSTVKSYLIDSHAWNYICKYIFQDKLGVEITKDCSEWGNYYDTKTINTRGLDVLYAVHNRSETNPSYAGNYLMENPNDVAPKGEGTNRLELSTGASEDFKKYNIYDMAGNMFEMTTESINKSTSEYAGYFVFRGSCFSNSGKVEGVVAAGVRRYVSGGI